MKNLEIRLTGTVQGVNLRATVQEHARRIGVGGFVRNEPNGTVFMEAEGDAETLDRFLQFLEAGPGSADVTDVSTRDAIVKDYTDFEVRE